MPFFKVVEHDHFVAFVEKQLYANAPDVTGAANDQNFHALGKCGATRVKSKGVVETACRVARRGVSHRLK
jgi:hypothetical protein